MGDRYKRIVGECANPITQLSVTPFSRQEIQLKERLLVHKKVLKTANIIHKGLHLFMH